MTRPMTDRDLPTMRQWLTGERLTRRRLLALGTAASAGALATAWVARAAVKVEITEGNVQPLPIAVPDFIGGSPAEAEMARNLSQVVTADLKRSGLFAPIDPAAFIEKIVNLDAVPRFPDWRIINAQALVAGRLSRQPDGPFRAEFRLWDVFAA